MTTIFNLMSQDNSLQNINCFFKHLETLDKKTYKDFSALNLFFTGHTTGVTIKLKDAQNSEGRDVNVLDYLSDRLSMSHEYLEIFHSYFHKDYQKNIEIIGKALRAFQKDEK